MSTTKKICTNPDCKASVGGYMFDEDANFCNICGSKLEVYELEENKLEKVIDTAGAVANKAGEIAKKAATEGVKVVEKYGPVVVMGAKKLAENPKVRAAVKEGSVAAVEYGKKFVKSPGIKKVINAGLKVLK